MFACFFVFVFVEVLGLVFGVILIWFGLVFRFGLVFSPQITQF